MSVHLTPYRSPQGETIGLIAFVSDITERKLMEEQLQDWKDREPTREPRRENAYGSPPGSEPYSIRSLLESPTRKSQLYLILVR